MTDILWRGLALLDSLGRVVVWRGSDTPKLFRGEEQGAHHRLDGCILEDIIVVRATKGAMPVAAPTATTPDRDIEQPVRHFMKKRCAARGCMVIFQPEGPRSLYCDAHRGKRKAA